MEVPKILWLSKHMSPQLFARCQFFDLPDFLTYRATGANTRSKCSVTCKCSYVPDKGWQTDFFERIGLASVPREGFRQMGANDGDVLTAGVPVGKGLSKQAAAELGLLEGTPVGSGVIDAYELSSDLLRVRSLISRSYAGWLGTIAARHEENGKLSPSMPFEESGHRLAAVAGTSTCHIVQVSLQRIGGSPVN